MENNKPEYRRDKKGKVIKDSAFFSQIGKMGGLTTKRRVAKKYGSIEAYYSSIGNIGGQVMKARGKEYYSKIGRMRQGGESND